MLSVKIATVMRQSQSLFCVLAQIHCANANALRSSKPFASAACILCTVLTDFCALPRGMVLAGMIFRWKSILDGLLQCKQTKLWVLACFSLSLVYLRMLSCAMQQALFPGDSELQQLLHIFKFLGTPDESIWPGVSKLRDWHEFPNWKAQDMSRAFPTLEPAGIDLMKAMFVYDPVKRMSVRCHSVPLCTYACCMPVCIECTTGDSRGDEAVFTRDTLDSLVLCQLHVAVICYYQTRDAAALSRLYFTVSLPLT